MTAKSGNPERAQASELGAFIGDQVGPVGRGVGDRLELVLEDLLLPVEDLVRVRHPDDSHTEEYEAGWSGSSLWPGPRPRSPACAI